MWSRRTVDFADLVNTRITGVSVVVTPAAVATVVPLPAASVTTTRAARRAVSEIVTGSDDRLAVIAGPCSIHDPAPRWSTPGSSAGCASGTATTSRS